MDIDLERKLLDQLREMNGHLNRLVTYNRDLCSFLRTLYGVSYPTQEQKEWLQKAMKEQQEQEAKH